MSRRAWCVFEICYKSYILYKGLVYSLEFTLDFSITGCERVYIILNDLNFVEIRCLGSACWRNAKQRSAPLRWLVYICKYIWDFKGCVGMGQFKIDQFAFYWVAVRGKNNVKFLRNAQRTIELIRINFLLHKNLTIHLHIMKKCVMLTNFLPFHIFDVKLIISHHFIRLPCHHNIQGHTTARKNYVLHTIRNRKNYELNIM